MSKNLTRIVIPAVLLNAAPAAGVASAELYRPAPETFGKFEARVRFAGGDGVISSFFLWKEGSERSDVYWNELDFEKVGDACELQTNSIYGLPQTNHEAHGYALEGLCDTYHTYGYEWTPDYVAWLIDGVEVRRDVGADASAYAENAVGGMQFRFNVWPGNASFGGNFSESTLPVYQFVAWAQYSEYSPGAGDGGSDFTLVWREEFDSAPAGWRMGSWASPLDRSTHRAQNVAFVDGIAVLALTADDALGYDGTPPGDDGTTTMVAAMVAAPSQAGAPALPFNRRSDGCACRLGTSAPSRWRDLVLLCLASIVWLRRRRAFSGRQPAND